MAKDARAADLGVAVREAIATLREGEGEGDHTGKSPRDGSRAISRMMITCASSKVLVTSSRGSGGP